MVLVLVPRLNFFSSMLWGRQTPGIEIGMMQGIYLILQWVPTRMVSVSPGPSTSLVGSLYQCWYLGQFYISVQHWIVPIFQKKIFFFQKEVPNENKNYTFLYMWLKHW
jgi:hypothetical protein